MNCLDRDEIEVAVREHLADQRIVLWGRAWGLLENGDFEGAVEWLTEQVGEVLDCLVDPLPVAAG